ncbi:MAG: NAD(P)/FAD-dependent oxidoreductase [Planctomycetaceae bacterium]
MPHKTALIIGGGPAGLTAAYELLQRTGIRPIVLEASDMLGGISRTVNYRGNRMDIGGHRFFSKSQRVMDWWQQMLPLEEKPAGNIPIAYQGKTHEVTPAACTTPQENSDEVMLVRPRKSRIYFLRKFFDYPISLSAQTIRNLGLLRTFQVGVSYLLARLFPIRNEQNLEQFFINRFGKALYLTFFKSYTEKVWGLPCDQISAAWGAQRIKGLSITKAIRHALGRLWKKTTDIRQKNVETSLVEQFLYPKLGPGQMWEKCGREIESQGGEIRYHSRVDHIHLSPDGKQVTSILVTNTQTGQTEELTADYVFSTMPIRDLVAGVQGTSVPSPVQEVAAGLVYRDFITVGLLLKKLVIQDPGKARITDNWIYVQEPDVQLGRIQIFNNWSEHLVAKAENVWLGLEYFCQEGDDLWNLSDDAMKQLAIQELSKIGIAHSEDILDGTVLRVPKTYPAYFGTYDRFGEVRKWVDSIENLFLIGRNGMHRYNNQDHSMLTAMVAVDNILAGRTDKANLWDVNTEQEYHEEQKPAAPSSPSPAATTTKTFHSTEAAPKAPREVSLTS